MIQFTSQEKNMIRKLEPIEIEEMKLSSILWSKGNTNTANSLMELQSMSPESSFQSEQNTSKQLILNRMHKIPQEA